MRTVYLDEVFLLDLVIDYFLLLAAARVRALPFRRGRFLAAAALGAAWSCLSLMPPLSFLGLPVMHPVLAVAMSLVAYGRDRALWRSALAFLGVSALFGGAVWAASLYRGRSLPPGTLVRLDLRVLAISFALCWAIVSAVFRRTEADAARRVHEVTLERGGRTVALRALEDTGNGLYDPVSGRGALVAEARALAPLFSAEEAERLRGEAADAALSVPGLRLLPYTDAGGKRSLLAAFRPERVTVDGAERDDLLAAVCPASLGGDGSYDAIL